MHEKEREKEQEKERERENGRREKEKDRQKLRRLGAACQIQCQIFSLLCVCEEREEEEEGLSAGFHWQSKHSNLQHPPCGACVRVCVCVCVCVYVCVAHGIPQTLAGCVCVCVWMILLPSESVQLAKIKLHIVVPAAHKAACHSQEKIPLSRKHTRTHTHAHTHTTHTYTPKPTLAITSEFYESVPHSLHSLNFSRGSLDWESASWAIYIYTWLHLVGI